MLCPLFETLKIEHWLSIAQIATTGVLASAGVIVAAASLIVAYRNSIGWKPIALIGRIGLRGVGGDFSNYTAMIDLEIWNRRKYPVSIRHITLTFDNLKIRQPERGNKKDATWYVGHNYVSNFDSHNLGPSNHEAHHIEVPFITDSLDRLNSPMQVRIGYFDPRDNKHKVLTVNHVYKLAENK